jgi:hypothetical protein
MNTLAQSNTKEVKLAKAVDSNLRRATLSISEAYRIILALMNENPAFKKEDGTFDTDAAYAAFEANTSTGMTRADLVNAARASKAIVNTFAPGTITDDVPPATITF